MHKRKIDMADEIFVINVSGYAEKLDQAGCKYSNSALEMLRADMTITIQ